MRIEPEAKKILEIVHLLSHLPTTKVRTVLESVLTCLIVDYLGGEETFIPFLGNFKILEEKGEVKVEFTPSPNIIRNIKQIRENKKFDVFKSFQKNLHKNLEKIVDGG